MTTSYNITFTDPLKTDANGFTIPAGDYNGPGPTLQPSNTTLRLFGQGAPLWGEAADENFVRLMEHFAGASAPLNPIGGQIWVRQTLYWLDTAGPTWYKFDFETPAGWDPTPITVTLAFSPSPLIGEYAYVTGKLWVYDTVYGQTAPQWIERAFASGTGAPVGNPLQEVLVYDEFLADWVDVSGGSTPIGPTAPLGPALGDLWFDTSVNVLKYWNGTTWIAISVPGGYLPLSGGTMTGTLNMGTNFITNVINPVNPQDAATKGYVDGAISGGGGAYVAKAGDTMTGNLTLPRVIATNIWNGTATTTSVETLLGGLFKSSGSAGANTDGDWLFGATSTNTWQIYRRASGSYPVFFTLNNTGSGTPNLTLGGNYFSTSTWDGVNGNYNQPVSSYHKWGATPGVNTLNDTLFGNSGSGVNTNWYWNGGSWVQTMATYPNGNFVIPGSGTGYNWFASSDIRVKTNIRDIPINHAMRFVMEVAGKLFDKKGEPDLGFIAQEVLPYFPQVVKEDPDGMLSLNYGAITAIHQRVIQHQQKQIDDILSRLQKIENRE